MKLFASFRSSHAGTALALLAFFLLSACATPPRPAPDRVVSRALPPAGGPVSLRALAPAAPPDADRFVLLDEGYRALAWRLALAAKAGRTIDVQYYLWHADAAGALVVSALCEAADRGVRVRMLVDDMFLEIADRHLAYLAAHSNIEVRVYNPLGSARDNALGRASEMVSDLSRQTRRMHNKEFIVDNDAAIIGGRNIGDPYFDLSPQMNFRDRELAVFGPAVTNLSRRFDQYWNHAWSVEAARVCRTDPDPASAAKYVGKVRAHAASARERLGTLDARVEDILRDLGATVAGAPTGLAEVVCDTPGKNDELDRYDAFGATAARLTEIASGVQRELIIESPYLVFMPGTFELIRELQHRGACVRIITSSMQSIDHKFVFAAYASQRLELLKAGVELYEVNTQSPFWRRKVMRRPAGGQAAIGLHAKTGVFDGASVFIGSFNLDPRSTHLNTEMGLYVRSPELAVQVRDILVEECAPANSWRVQLDRDGRLTWSGEQSGRPVTLRREPGIGWGGRLWLWAQGLLPVRKLL